MEAYWATCLLCSERSTAQSILLSRIRPPFAGGKPEARNGEKSAVRSGSVRRKALFGEAIFGINRELISRLLIDFFRRVDKLFRNKYAVSTRKQRRRMKAKAAKNAVLPGKDSNYCKLIIKRRLPAFFLLAFAQTPTLEAP
jgi:hypothetical protein